MLKALVEDLAKIGEHQIVTTADVRIPLAVPAGVDVMPLGCGLAQLNKLIASVDAVWLVAPEANRCLERLTARVERTNKLLLGSSSSAIRRASDKIALPRRLGRYRISHPPTRGIGLAGNYHAAAGRLGYPLVVKPRRGAGCEGVGLVRGPRELRRAWEGARRVDFEGPLVFQSYIRGVAASVSLLADGRQAVPLALNAQSVRSSSSFSYRGGMTPLDHPLADSAVGTAVRAAESVPGLRGYIGVDLVLTQSEVVVIEINPRLTTAYLGVRAAVDENVAALSLVACAGLLPERPRVRRRVRFSSTGRVVACPGTGLS